MHAASSSPGPGLTPIDGDDLLISQPAFNRRIRRVGLGANVALAIVSLSTPRDLVAAAVFGSIAALIGLVEARGALAGRPPSPGSWRVTVAAILVVATVAVLLTGGMQSVLLALFVPIAFTLGFSVPDARVSLMPTMIVAGLCVVSSVSLPAGHQVTWSWLAPTDPARHAILLPVMLAVFAGLCSRLGRLARGSLLEARRAVEQAQAERVSEIAERHAGLVGLMGAVAHELKNPMTTVQSLTSHMHRKAADGSPLHVRLGVVRGEVARMRTTVDGLLNAARPLSAHVVGREGLHRLAAEVVATHRTLAHGRGIELVLGEGVAEAVFDRRKLVQVVGNLVLNAIEASSDGGRIVVDVGHAAGRAWLEVVDDGVGIADDIRAVLGRPGVTSKPRGSGIGLALSVSIIEQHGGELTLADGPEGGCRARIWLPMGPAERGAPEES